MPPSPERQLNRLLQLIREIHRRSLWQVLVVYVGASWAALQVVDTVAGALQLPDWLEPVALVMLIVGLPMVLATAIVQKGVGGGRSEDATASSAVAPAGAALFTWRNALGGGVLAFALSGVVAAGWVLFGGASPEAPDESVAPAAADQSIAVLPFRNMSGNVDNEYFSDGITEELLNALAQLPGLRVPGRASSFAFKGQNPTIHEVADTLGVANILEGSVRRDRDRVLITAQLIDARTDSHLWSQTYERELADIFAIQREIAEAIVGQLQVELGQDQVLVQTPTDDLDAYDLYLRARAAYQNRASLTGTTGVEVALDLYNRAISADPNYAVAHAGAAEAWANPGAPGGSNLVRAEAEARLALAADSTLVLPWLVLANVARDRREYEDAQGLYEVALQGLPNDPEMHHEYGEYLFDVGRCEDAVAEQRRALEIDPQSSRAVGYLAMTLVCAGRIEEGLGQLRRSVAEFGGTHQSGATFAFVEGGRVEEGIEYARSVDGGWFLTIAEGVRDGVRRAADLNVTLPRYSPVAAWGLTLLGDDEEALRIVENCVEGPCGAGQLAWLWMPTVQRRLGDNPRFQTALREIGMLRQ